MLYKNTVQTVELFGETVPEPRVLIDFLGFQTHLVQIRDKRGAKIWPGWFDHAAYYSVDISADKLFGPGEEVTIPAFVKAPDYEFEIAVLCTKEALITSQEEGLEYLKEHCYFTILNDWSARDVQKKDMDGLGPTNSKFIIGNSIGPKLVKGSAVKMDENGVPFMELTLKVNGEERCRSNYQSLYHEHPEKGEKKAWSFPRLFAWLGSENIGLKPGYLIGSGTVGNGCIAEFSAKVDPATGAEITPAKYGWLKDGDVVTMEAEGIGVLENKVRIKALAHV
jgi:fumarylacetoacetate (FAA) hydrolase